MTLTFDFITENRDGEQVGDRAADGQSKRTLIVRTLAALLLLAAASPTEAQMILPEVPHYEFRPAPEANYGQPYDASKTKGSDENNKGQNPKSFRERLSGTLDKSLSVLYLYGNVRYWDLFPVNRQTGFMFEYIPNWKSPEKGVFVMCPHAMWYDIEEEPEAQSSGT